MNTNFILFLTIFSLVTIILADLQDFDFTYQNYNEIMRKIQKFSSDYPFNIRVYNDTSEKIDLPDVKNCGNEQFDYFINVLSYILII